MKIDITFKDATAEQINLMLNALNGTVQVSAIPFQVVDQNQLQLPFNNNLNDDEDDDEDDSKSQPSSSGLDARGFPWDERIHSANKQQTGNGVWRRKRGVDDATVLAVEKELKGDGLPAAPLVAQLPIQVQPQVVQQAIPTQVQPQIVQQAIPTQVQPQIVQQAIPINQESENATSLMNYISSMLGNGLIDHNYINSLCQRIGQAFNVQLSAVVDIINRPDMIAHAFTLLRTDGKIV